MKNGLKKEDSLLIHGIAILMMIYHHLFSIPEKLGNANYFSILNTIFGGNTGERVAWLFSLCLTSYAFISGYGICSIISKKSYEERCSLTSIPQNYILAFKQIFKLLKKYWLVFIIFIPIGVRFFGQSLIGPKTFTRSLLGLANDYNAEWWYIKQYIMMILLFPLFDFIFCNVVSFLNNCIIKKFKYGQHIILGIIFFCGFLFLIFRNAPVFSYLISQLNNGIFVCTIVFFTGYLCSFFHLFEIGADNSLFQKIRPFLTFIMLFACLSIRYIRAYDAVYFKYDSFITTPIIYSFVTLFSYIGKPITNFLRYLGKHSTYMWLTHTFFCYYYFSHWISAAKVSILMFLLTLFLSLGTSIILTGIENFISKTSQKMIGNFQKTKYN